MTRRNITLISIAILVAGIVVGGIIGWAAFPREKEVTKEVKKEVPMSLPATAEAIKKGEIDVGKEYGLALEQRYHKIHTTVLGLECATCHLAKVDAKNKVFSAWNVSPQAPGPVDQRGCLGCHHAGLGGDLYGSIGP
jgi:hypothetical protein